MFTAEAYRRRSRNQRKKARGCEKSGLGVPMRVLAFRELGEAGVVVCQLYFSSGRLPPLPRPPGMADWGYGIVFGPPDWFCGLVSPIQTTAFVHLRRLAGGDSCVCFDHKMRRIDKVLCEDCVRFEGVWRADGLE